MSWNRGKLPEGGVSSALGGNDDTLPSRMRWNHLADIGAIVGQCRRGCGGALVPIKAGPHDAEGEDGQITWYEVRCLGCGDETAAPNGRILRRSSLRSEMPSQWWETRERRDREQKQQRQGGGPE